MNYRLLASITGGACVLSLFVLSARQPVSPQPEPLPQSVPVAHSAVPVDFNRDILPILSSKCFACHGPDEHKRKAGLRLDLRESAIKPARSGDTPIKPGHAAASEVVRRIFALEESERMPPIKGGKPLSESEKKLIQRWIDQGAEYQLHWAFLKPRRSTIPEVNNKAWVRNPIDAFILHRLEQEGLKPAPAADRATLIRRLSLDLRGLPPSLEELDEFLADQSPDAYAKLVDRFLASPQYGEKMTQIWLDLARFGDTSGFHYDSTRQMWLWRDWVINAFNKNMPFDQFTIEQIAGDLLPGPTVDQKIATGFHRCTRFNEEGGVDPEEYVIRYNIDRTNTLGQVWLGLTLGCAECHNHRYDPISQKEYYQLYAYFTGITEPMKSGNHGKILPPFLKLPTPEQTRELVEHRKQLARVEEAIAKAFRQFNDDYKDPLEGKRSALLIRRVASGCGVGRRRGARRCTSLRPVGLGGGAEVSCAERQEVRCSGRVRALHQHGFYDALQTIRIHLGDKLFAYVWLDAKNPPQSIMLQWNDGAWEHRAYWGADKSELAGQPNGAEHFHAGALPAPGAWARLEIDAEKVGLKPGAVLNGMTFSQFGGSAYYDKAGVNTLYSLEAQFLQSQIAWELKESHNATLPDDVVAALQAESAKRTMSQKKLLRDYYLRKVWQESRDTFASLQEDFDKESGEIKKLEDAIPSTLITEELPKPRPAHVLIRGDFQHKGEKVEPGVPAVFPPLPRDVPNTRLGLARWLVSPDHPLTARVAVNRLWAQMFGAGIVSSLGDFGSQGDYPSHPELLDWLAVEFMSASSTHPAWDMKAMLRTIALSATYLQSSAYTSAGAKVDPSNRLLHRAPRHRISAEEVRDSILGISGLLSTQVGGPSFMPYQPSHFYKGKDEDWVWKASEGEDQYRRGMYAFWRRNSLHPMFAIFDAPPREECTVFRGRTNTPLAALVTLNDPSFVEAARVFAEKILTLGPKDVDGRLTYAFRRATCRRPTEPELKVLRQRLTMQLDRYRADPETASKFVNVGPFPRDATLDVFEHAAWMAIANMLLNLDEVLTRE